MFKGSPQSGVTFSVEAMESRRLLSAESPGLGMEGFMLQAALCPPPTAGEQLLNVAANPADGVLAYDADEASSGEWMNATDKIVPMVWHGEAIEVVEGKWVVEIERPEDSVHGRTSPHEDIVPALAELGKLGIKFEQYIFRDCVLQLRAPADIDPVVLEKAVSMIPGFVSVDPNVVVRNGLPMIRTDLTTNPPEQPDSFSLGFVAPVSQTMAQGSLSDDEAVFALSDDEFVL